MKKKFLPCLFIALFFLTLLRLVIAAALSLSPDEAYYWVWSQALDYSYYDHPPMVALWIKAGCLIWGKTELGVRFLGPVAAFIGSIFVFFATKDFNCHREDSIQKAIISVLLLNATLTVGVGSIILTPDTPLLFFICMQLWACGRLIYTKSVQYWWLISISAGLALLSKYTALLIIIALGIWCIFSKEGRSYLKKKELWGGAILTCAIFSPVIIWNSQHQWISFLKQGGRTTDWNPGRALQFLSELAGGQIGLSTPVIFICFGIGFIYLTRIVWQRKCDSGSFLLWLMIIFPAFIFIQHAVGDRVQANWVGILYPVLAIIAGLYVQRWLKTGIVVGFLIVTGLYVQAIFAVVPLPGKKDMLLKQLGGWSHLTSVIDARVDKGNVIISDNYGLVSELAFYCPHRSVIAIGTRWKYFNLPTSFVTKGYFIRRQHSQEGSPLIIGRDNYFSQPSGSTYYQLFDSIARIQGKRIAQLYEIYQVSLRPDLAKKGESKLLQYE